MDEDDGRAIRGVGGFDLLGQRRWGGGGCGHVATLPRRLDAPLACERQDVALLVRHDAQRDVAARGAAQHPARAPVRAMRADRVDRTARLAAPRRVGQLGAERLHEHAGEHVAIQVSSHPPVGPNRSAWIAAGAWPSPTSRSATASTNGVGPQTKTRGASATGGPTAVSISASTRRSKPPSPPAPRASACGARPARHRSGPLELARYRMSSSVREDTSRTTGASLPAAAR